MPSRIWAGLVVILIVFSGCSKAFQSRAPQIFSFEDSSPEVHFEPVDAEGNFLEHAIVEDPMRADYERGVWEASQKSDVETLGTTSSTAANRVDIVFVGDGYTQAETDQYRKDVEENIKRLKTDEPFKSYINYFQFHRVDVVSKESGVSQELKGQKKKTALEMTFYCSGLQRLLCINANKAMKEAQNAPAVDAVFALANTDVYGGAGYRSPAISTLAARNPAATELALHEFAHSFAGLGDEYDYEGTGEGCSKYPNVTTATAASLLKNKEKWWRWLDLPHIGVFKGSCYSAKYNRPTENSKMRTLGKPFYEVNAEQMVIGIYKKVRPIEFATPTGTIKGNQILQVIPMKPVSHRLAITWKLGSTELSQFAHQESLDTSKLGLKKGTHTITATVVDPTAAVRDEKARKKYMTQTLQWKLKL